MDSIKNLEFLANAIHKTNEFFLSKVQKQVNTALTLRNWIIGFYLVEYEQHGEDRAVYGQRLYNEIARQLKSVGLKSIRERHLYLCKDFYKQYPQILLSPFAKSYLSDFKDVTILRTLSAKSESVVSSKDQLSQNKPELLINTLSFSHFIELMKADTPLKRLFYETEVIRNNWSVRQLQRAMNSLLFERTGLSKDKKAVIQNHANSSDINAEEVFRNPYLLEFLGLEEKASYSETDLEEAIITHLQTFLLELGKGFCFEARQKRITFDNRHYRIDLVFFHRILRCHVLLDLKIGEFTHEDAGQMNMYLNYYKESEMHKDDSPPVGIILCAGKNEALVKYATSGLAQKVFVSKYMINLPSEIDLLRIIEQEQGKLQQ